jgi:hypothetical protein
VWRMTIGSSEMKSPGAKAGARCVPRSGGVSLNGSCASIRRCYVCEMSRLLIAGLLFVMTALVAPSHASPLGICTTDAKDKGQGVRLLTRPDGSTRGHPFALDDGMQVRVDDIYGRNWVYIVAIIHTGESGNVGPTEVADGWVKRSDLKCTGGENFPPPFHYPPASAQTGHHSSTPVPRIDCAELVRLYGECFDE